MFNDNRPSNWEEFYGQNSIIKNLQIYIESSILREKILDPIIISGPSGMGKTSLAYLTSKILKSKIHIINGPNLQKPSDLISVLTSIKEKDTLFIDEVHALSKETLEILYPVLEENKLSIIVGKEYNSKVVNIKLPNFYILVATTDISKLPFPFINRFPISFYLEEYSNQDLNSIVLNNAKKFKMLLNEESATTIASFSKSTPRISINLLKRINDYFVMGKISSLDKESILWVFREMNIYKYGLSIKDIDYLNSIKNGSYVGLDNISQIINIPPSMINTNIEPTLIKYKLIERTFKGRKITDKGKQYLVNLIKTNS